MQWQAQQAKARFSEVVKAALNGGPQAVSLRGKPAVMIISQADYDRLLGKKPSLIDFMRRSPLVGLDLDFEREQDTGREIDL